MTFKNILNDGPQSEHHLHTMPVGVLDAVYSPDGASLAVTDYVSRAFIYYQCFCFCFWFQAAVPVEGGGDGRDLSPGLLHYSCEHGNRRR